MRRLLRAVGEPNPAATAFMIANLIMLGLFWLGGLEEWRRDLALMGAFFAFGGWIGCALGGVDARGGESE